MPFRAWTLTQFLALPALLALLTVLAAPVAAAPPALYVAVNGNDRWSGRLPAPNGHGDGPFATIDQARRAIAARKRGGRPAAPIPVEIRAGVYFLAKPLTFTDADSGAPGRPVLYEAYHGEAVTLSGGRQIQTRWTPFPGNPHVYVTHLPEAAAGGWNFASLYVNSVRATRARLPATGFYRLDPALNAAAGDPHRSFTASQGEVDPNWTGLNDIEVVDDHRWQQDRQRIASVTATTANGRPAVRVTVTGYNNSGFGGDYAGNDRYYLDNVFAGLTGPGEWYLNRQAGDLYLWPPAGQDPNQTRIEAPATAGLVRFQGAMNRLPMRASGAFSVSYWIKTRQTGDFQTVVNGIDSQGYALSLHDGKMRVDVGYSANAHNTAELNPAVVNDNAWHLLTTVLDNSHHQMIGYVDGVAGPPQYLGLPQFSANQDAVPGIIPFNGAISELYVYNRALTAGEVQILFQRPAPPVDGRQVALTLDGSLADSGPFALPYRSPKPLAFVPGPRGRALQMAAGDPRIAAPNTRRPVHDITLSGLHFTLTDEPLIALGFDNSGGSLASFTYSPMVKLEGAENITIQNCVLDHGSGFGIEAVVSSHDRFLHNTLSDLGAGGIGVGIFSGEIPSAVTGGNVISDNTIHDIGKYFSEGPGILADYTQGNVISHNRISHAPYTGISLGIVFVATAKTQGNRVEYNDIHDVMQELNDGAGIYTVGPEQGSVIRFNRIHDIQNANPGPPDLNYLSAGIYLDENSRGVTVSDNLVYRTGSSLLLHNITGSAQVVRNNIFVDGRGDNLINSGVTDLRLTRTIFYDGASPPAAAPIAPASPGLFALSDSNLFYPAARPHAWDSLLAAQRAGGLDTHSRIADPLFAGYAQDNFRLSPASPALALGFRPIDLSAVGPRPH